MEVPVHQEILYLDDFIHQNSNIVHWDHVKFNHVVYLEQIRVIPKFCTVPLRNGQKHHGQTSPNKFKLEFYANNLNRGEDRATLEKIGSILYDDSSSSSRINSDKSSFLLEPSSLPMDWLVIVGSYTCLSIAIIGVKAKARSNPTTTTSSLQESFQTSIGQLNQPPPQFTISNQNQILANINSILSRPPPPNFIQTPPPTTTSTGPHLTAPNFVPPSIHSQERDFYGGGGSSRAQQLQNQQPALLPTPPPTALINSHHISTPNLIGLTSQTGIIRSRDGQMRFQPQQYQPQRGYNNNNSNNQSQHRYHPYLNTSSKYSHQSNRPNEITHNSPRQVNNPSSSPPNDELKDSEKLTSQMNDSDLNSTDSSIDTLQEASVVPMQPVESSLVKSYLDLDENRDERLVVEGILTSACKTTATPKHENGTSGENELESYLNEQFTTYSEKIDPTFVKNPCLNNYELYLQQTVFANDEKSNETPIINEYLAKFEKLFSHNASTPTTTPTTKSTSLPLNVDQLNFLDSLLVLLKQPNKLSFQLYRNIFANKPQNLNHLISLITDHLLRQTGNKKSLNLALKLANLLLNKFDDQCFHSLSTAVDSSTTAAMSLSKKLINSNLQIKLIEIASECCDSLKLKCFNCLFNMLNSKHGCQAFSRDGYSNFLSLFSGENKKLTSRISIAVATIVSKIAFYESLSQFSHACEQKLKYQSSSSFKIENGNTSTHIESKKPLVAEENENEFQTSILKYLETIYKFLYMNLKSDQNSADAYYIDDSDESTNCANFDDNYFNQMPIQNLFDDFLQLKTDKLPTFNSLLRFMHEFSFFTHSVLVWSYLGDSTMSHRTAESEKISEKIGQLFLNFLLPSDLNNLTLAGIEYLLVNNRLTKCLFKLIKNSPIIIQISKLIEIMKAIDLLKSNLDGLRSSSSDNQILILKSLNLIQSVNFELTLTMSLASENHFSIIDILVFPDGNLSNKYASALLNWFEYVIEDRNFVGEEQDENGDFSRLFIINALANIFYHLCKSNSRWNLNKSTRNMCLLNKLVSNLINYLIITKLKPSLSVNKSYFVLIEKLKSIKYYIEPLTISSTMTNSAKKQTNLNVITNLNSLNTCIDLFRENIDKNLSLFFAKIHLKNNVRYQRFHINYLNVHITQLRFIKNLIYEPTVESISCSPGGLAAARDWFKLSQNLSKRLYLGHLISRNFLQILVNYLSRLNDYLMFYFYLKNNELAADSSGFNLYSIFDLLLNLIEPTLYIIKVNLLNLDNRNKLVHILTTLLKFYALFTHIFKLKQEQNRPSQYSQKLKLNHKRSYSKKSDKQLQQSLIKRSKIISKHFLQIFLAFTNRAQLFNELAKFCLDAPFNMIYGLNLIKKLLTALNGDNLTPHLKILLNQPNSSFQQLLDQMYMFSTRSNLFFLGESVFSQIAKSSNELCKSICSALMFMLNSKFELLKTANSLGEFEIKIEINATENNKLSDLSSNEESIYDTKAVWADEEENAKEPSSSVNENGKVEISNETSVMEKTTAIVPSKSVDDLESDTNDSCDQIYKFTKLIKFICGLINKSKEIRNEIAMHVKVDFIGDDYNFLKPDSYKYILIDMIKYFKQIDSNQTSNDTFVSSGNMIKIQQSSVEIIECLLRQVPNLLSKNSNDTDPNNLIKLMVKTFTDHLNITKFDLIELNTSLITCLIHLFKRESLLNAEYFKLASNNTDFLGIIAEFSQQIKINNGAQLIDLMNKFYIYINQIIECLAGIEKFQLLKENILKWSSRITNEMLIDSISTSNSFSMQSNNQHPLIELDKMIETIGSQIPRDEPNQNGLNKKYKLLLNQSKALLRLLNEFEPENTTTWTVYSQSTIYKEAEQVYNLKPTSDYIETNSSWSSATNPQQIIDDMVEIDIDDVRTSVPNSNESNLLTNKDLYEKLMITFEENELMQQLQQQYQPHSVQISAQISSNLDDQSSEASIKLEKQQFLDDQSTLNGFTNGNNEQPVKAKSEVINTRTGIKYKAPMRGGHTNHGTRVQQQQASSNQSSNNHHSSNAPRFDPFRTRAPNTSRPPSLHVDEYVRMESATVAAQKQQQQQQQLQNNQIETQSENSATLIKSNSFSGDYGTSNSNSNLLQIQNSTYPKLPPPPILPPPPQQQQPSPSIFQNNNNNQLMTLNLGNNPNMATNSNNTSNNVGLNYSQENDALNLNHINNSNNMTCHEHISHHVNQNFQYNNNQVNSLVIPGINGAPNCMNNSQSLDSFMTPNLMSPGLLKPAPISNPIIHNQDQQNMQRFNSNFGMVNNLMNPPNMTYTNSNSSQNELNDGIFMSPNENILINTNGPGQLISQLSPGLATSSPMPQLQHNAFHQNQNNNQQNNYQHHQNHLANQQQNHHQNHNQHHNQMQPPLLFPNNQMFPSQNIRFQNSQTFRTPNNNGRRMSNPNQNNNQNNSNNYNVRQQQFQR